MLDDGYGIMPNKILFDDELSSTSKLIFVYISSLCSQKGYCWASNESIAKKFNMNKTTISTLINQLDKYLIIEARGMKRVIRLKQPIKASEKSKASFGKFKSKASDFSKHNNIKEYYNIKRVKPIKYKTPHELGMPDLSCRA